jgi:hypothetical protein
MRYIRGHAPQPTRLTWGESLWQIEDRGYETPCWIWLRAKDTLGYGIFANKTRLGASRLAHRESFIRAYGMIPQGLELDHLCRQSSCVRPEHLEAVTHAENLKRGAISRASGHIDRLKPVTKK